MEPRGRHFDKSTLLLSNTLTPVMCVGVEVLCPGVVGGDVDFGGSNEEVRDIETVDSLGVLLFP